MSKTTNNKENNKENKVELPNFVINAILEKIDNLTTQIVDLNQSAMELFEEANSLTAQAVALLEESEELELFLDNTKEMK